MYCDIRTDFACILTIGICMSILGAVGKWKIFEKAGVKSWHSVIPVLNLYDWYQIAGLGKGWAVIGTAGWIFTCFVMKSLMPMYGSFLLGFAMSVMFGSAIGIAASGGVASWFFGASLLRIYLISGYMTFGKILLGAMFMAALVIHLVSFFRISEKFGKRAEFGALFILFEDIMYAVIGLSPEWKYLKDEDENKQEDSLESSENSGDSEEETEEEAEEEKGEDKTGHEMQSDEKADPSEKNDESEKENEMSDEKDESDEDALTENSEENSELYDETEDDMDDLFPNESFGEGDSEEKENK